MKKKILLALAVCAMAVMVAACGSKADTETTAATTTAATDGTKETTETGNNKETTAAKESTSAKETASEETTEAGPQAGPGFDPNESEVAEKNQDYEALENSDYDGFAKQVVEAVTAKDINALADLMAYPTYVSCVKENEGIVDSKEQFLALDKEALFDEELIEAMKKADLSDLTPLMTGVVIGDDTPNIIFNSVNGELGITGINY